MEDAASAVRAPACQPPRLAMPQESTCSAVGKPCGGPVAASTAWRLPRRILVDLGHRWQPPSSGTILAKKTCHSRDRLAFTQRGRILLQWSWRQILQGPVGGQAYAGAARFPARDRGNDRRGSRACRALLGRSSDRLPGKPSPSEAERYGNPHCNGRRSQSLAGRAGAGGRRSANARLAGSRGRRHHQHRRARWYSDREPRRRAPVRLPGQRTDRPECQAAHAAPLS